MLNFHTLMYISVDDLDELLTLSHILIYRHVMILPDHVPSQDSNEKVTANVLSK